jgi:hypothetical protein
MNMTQFTATAPIPGPVRRALLTREYVQAVGRMADIWGWPIADGSQSTITSSQAPETSANLTADVAVDACELARPNLAEEDGFDAALSDLSEMEPATADQVHDFGDHFWVFPLYDQASSPCCSANASGVLTAVCD